MYYSGQEASLIIDLGILPGLSNRPTLYFSFSGSPCNLLFTLGSGRFNGIGSLYLKEYSVKMERKDEMLYTPFTPMICNPQNEATIMADIKKSIKSTI